MCRPDLACGPLIEYPCPTLSFCVARGSWPLAASDCCLWQTPNTTFVGDCNSRFLMSVFGMTDFVRKTDLVRNNYSFAKDFVIVNTTSFIAPLVASHF